MCQQANPTPPRLFSHQKLVSRLGLGLACLPTGQVNVKVTPSNPKAGLVIQRNCSKHSSPNPPPNTFGVDRKHRSDLPYRKPSFISHSLAILRSVFSAILAKTDAFVNCI